MHGMTLKQLAKYEFFTALDAYKRAETMSELVAASVRLHVASGGVPKRYRPMVGQAFREKQLKGATA